MPPQSSSPDASSALLPLLVCFSHLRWDFVFQRPQHLMRRMGQRYRVKFWEEPLFDAAGDPWLEYNTREGGSVETITPHLAPGAPDIDRILRNLLDGFLSAEPVALRWYYSPMMLPFSRHIDAACTVYDCMDELANFRFAPEGLIALENELFDAADIVFTGGHSLYEAKRKRHDNVHPFPSSVEVEHFREARTKRAISARPCFGFYGVIDERMDLQLVQALAAAHPEWDVELIGPVVKIDPADLPREPNLRYPGARLYADLPAVVARWDVALMPFAINDATRFISPTKTPEYLAAGLPVVSTAIADVIRGYNDVAGVTIAHTSDAFIRACEAALMLRQGDGGWLSSVDEVLAQSSWDKTVSDMQAIIARAAPRAFVKKNQVRADYDWLVVGAGFAGAVMAERLAADASQRVLLIDRRPHVAGNAFDCRDDAGILIHRYGPHIFHTNCEEIFGYLSRFTKWRPYEHRVLADLDGLRVPIPINRTTLNKVYGTSLENAEDARVFLADRSEAVASVSSSEDMLVSTIGRDLYEKFFRGYTRKQWGCDPSALDKSVAARVPARTSTDDRYFTDRYQAMPADGFTAMFQRMLDHPNIDVRLGTEFAQVRDSIACRRIVFTGPIDEYFDYRYGRLPYRSLRFDHRTEACEIYQPVAVVNYPAEEIPHTRVTEYKHLTGQKSPVTSVTYEYPASEGDPYYPIPSDANQALYKRYEELARSQPDVIFVGRLATYRYYNMDQVVGQALAAYRRLSAEVVVTKTAAE